MRRSLGLAAPLVLSILALGGCGHGTVIGSAPIATPTPAPPSVTKEFAVPTANSQPTGLTIGSDGYIYFTEFAGNNIGQMGPTGISKEFAVKTAASGPFDITTGPDAALWFTEKTANQIGTMPASGGTIAEYALPSGAAPTYIVEGPNQNTLAFSEPGIGSIGSISTGGAVTQCALPGGANPQALALSGTDQDLYVVDPTASVIYRVNLHTTPCTVTSFPTTTANAGPASIRQGPDGNMWFTENTVAKIASITPSGIITEYALSPATSAGAMTVGADSNFHFADTAQNKLGESNVLVPTTVTEATIPTTTTVGKMIIGPDGLIYFTETTGNNIGQFTY